MLQQVAYTVLNYETLVNLFVKNNNMYLLFQRFCGFNLKEDSIEPGEK